jgi:hypothetical protein
MSEILSYMHTRLHESTSYSSQILKTLESSGQIKKNTQISSGMKILPGGAELSNADIWT